MLNKSKNLLDTFKINCDCFVTLKSFNHIYELLTVILHNFCFKLNNDTTCLLIKVG